MSRNYEFNDSGMVDHIKQVFTALDTKGAVRARKSLWSGLMLFTMLAVLASVLWYSYPRETKQQEILAAPIIRADAGPIKIAPENPGGMKVPYQDSTIFETLASDESAAPRRIENLFSGTEEPLDKDKLFAGLKLENDIETQNNSAPQEPNVEKKETPQDKIPNIETAALSEIPQPEQKPEMMRQAAVVSKIEPTASSSTAPANTASSGDYYIQLASVRSPEGAKKTWTDMKAKYPEYFDNIGFRIQMADLQERGIYYRIQAGPTSKNQADNICRSLQQKKSPGACLVIHR